MSRFTSVLRRVLLSALTIAALTIIGVVVVAEGNGGEAAHCEAGLAEEGKLLQSLALDVAKSEGAVIGPLLRNTAYVLVIRGTFEADQKGRISDGWDLQLNKTRITSPPNARHTYCVDLNGFGRSISVAARDSYYGDNTGELLVDVFVLE